jgi:hypothetical protein
MMNDPSRTFHPDTACLLGKAFDEAWERLGRGGPKDLFAVERNDLAKVIIALAIKGERDHKRLVEGALAATPHLPDPPAALSRYRQPPKAFSPSYWQPLRT